MKLTLVFDFNKMSKEQKELFSQFWEEYQKLEKELINTKEKDS